MPDPASTVWRLVERRAEATPGAEMLRDEHDRSLTFDDVRQATEEVAAGLFAAGVQPGDAVGWQLPSTLDAIVLMLALARLGVRQTPVLPVLRHREVSYILRQNQADFFVVPGAGTGFDHEGLARRIAAESGVRPLVLPRAGAGRFGLRLPRGDPSQLPPPPAGVDEVRWCYYTSGTTADPKGVQHSDRTVAAAANSLVHVGWLSPDDAICAPMPVTHIGGMMVVAAALRSGCRLLIVEGFDPATTPAFAAAHGASVLGMVAPAFPAFYAAQQAKGADPLLPRLRFIFSGGAPLDPRLHVEARATLGGAGVLNTWGLTEAPQVTFTPLDATEDQKAATAGQPGVEVDVRVVEAEGGRCPVGVAGQLLVRGPQLFLGYVDSTLDVAGFDEDGFLRTGDLGFLDADGFVHVTGRLKDVIIRNGENIAAPEVERIMLAHPSVVDVAVIGLPDPRTGERCCAVVQLAPGAPALTIDEVRRHFDQAGAARQKTPEQLEIVDAVPRNDLGKALKTALRQRLLDHASSTVT